MILECLGSARYLTPIFILSIIQKKTSIIGNDVFVGNRSTIGKGTILPNGSIVSCNSNVSGDFSINSDNILIKGNPAVFVKNNLIMGNSFYPEKEEIVAQMLNE